MTEIYKPAAPDLFDGRRNPLHISGLIALLQDIQARHGDLPVSTERQRGGVRAVTADDIQTARIKPPRRHERILRYDGNGESADGTKVLRIC